MNADFQNKSHTALFRHGQEAADRRRHGQGRRQGFATRSQGTGCALSRL